MLKNLVIVESPAKARTIEKFLGKDYHVMSSYGHVRDLVKKGMGIDIEHGFAPDYEVPADKKKVVAELAKAAREADAVWLASDEDREGEAIAWHLTQVLGLPVESTRRIAFQEITKNAIMKAVENPRTVDMNRVNAQQARRILDRLVGFELSPLLWRKVRPSLSAGRVQSVAVRLIVEREREIIGFEPSAYFRVTAEFVDAADASNTVFTAELNKRFETKEQARVFLEKCIGAEFTVGAVERKPATKSPAPPFTTSTLQQEAGRKFGMSVAMTMSTAQKLYEHGFITYMRTDSVNLSGQALAAAKEEIVKLFGAEYSQTRNFTTKSKGAQEAHEAIRPSYIDKADIEGTPAEKKLYDLIRKRTLASQMSAAQIERTTVHIDINTTPEHFTAVGEVIMFDGFLRLYSESTDDDHESETADDKLPPLKKGARLSDRRLVATQRFTQSPPRYSEATLVRRLEELGIGRPSTYAPTISTIVTRGYVVKQNRDGVKRTFDRLVLEKSAVSEKPGTETVGREKNKLAPTDIGMVVTDYLEAEFTGIMDYHFTARVEKEFDEIAEGGKSWEAMLAAFYAPFHTTVSEAMQEKEHRPGQSRVLGRDPATGREVLARIGRYGPIVQIEPVEEGEKPRYASMRKDQLIASITLEEALELFSLPRNIGQFEGSEVVIGVGRFGPYVRHDGKFVSLAKTDDPHTVTLERAAELISVKRANDIAAKTPLRTFDVEPVINIMNGRYGPYIVFDGANYPIPKNTDPATLDLDAVRALIEKGKEKKRGKR
ncbi:MAG: type I DNA topoisomerase [Rikenellaceae bacterium]|nr:type I DNA topoisomerase [Rikenellaceae bacterium]MCL2692712.1 type I DNA topoisomerase [Rikenellaceae bacterium]